MGIGIARYVGLSKADARTVRPYMPLACKSFFNRTNPKVQNSMFNVQSQSPYMPILAGTDLKHLLGNVYGHL